MSLVYVKLCVILLFDILFQFEVQTLFRPCAGKQAVPHSQSIFIYVVFEGISSIKTPFPFYFQPCVFPFQKGYLYPS